MSAISMRIRANDRSSRRAVRRRSPTEPWGAPGSGVTAVSDRLWANPSLRTTRSTASSAASRPVVYFTLTMLTSPAVPCAAWSMMRARRRGDSPPGAEGIHPRWIATGSPRAAPPSGKAARTSVANRATSGATARYLVYPGDLDPWLNENLASPTEGTACNRATEWKSTSTAGRGGSSSPGRSRPARAGVGPPPAGAALRRNRHPRQGPHTDDSRAVAARGPRLASHVRGQPRSRPGRARGREWRRRRRGRRRRGCAWRR